MAVNRVSITINSRQYTVVAEESREYIERLGEHINEKVKKRFEWRSKCSRGTSYCFGGT